jgi:hypothetical protein
MEKKISALALACALTLIVTLSVMGLTGCKASKGDSTSDDNRIMDLIDQSGYFKGAPKELYFGEALQESSSDQGVTVKYLASFNDGEATYLFFDLIDTGADLFGKESNGFDFSLEKYDFLEKAGYTDSKIYDVISYDKKTRTATICVEYIGPLNKDISFHIYSMSGNQKMINLTVKDLDLYGMQEKEFSEFEQEDQFRGASTSFGIMDEETGLSQSVDMPEFDEGSQNTIYRLKKDMLALPVKDVEGNHIADITNIGWRDGWLHIQINPNNNINWNTDFNLKSNKTGELLYSPFNMSFGLVNGRDEPNDYYEYVFYVGDRTQDNLDYSILFRNANYRATDLTGDWEIKFVIPDSLVKKLEPNKSIPVKGNELLIQRAVVSPVNITLFASRKDVTEELMDWFGRLYLDDLDIKIVYQDGSIINIPKQSGSQENQKGKLFRYTYTAKNFDDIIGLEVNGVLFSVDD